MSVYYGVVKDNVVVLPADIRLAEGLIVEVHIPPSAAEEAGQLAPEDLFKQRLIELGLLEEIKMPPLVPPLGDRTPIQVEGKLLSQIIIEERR